MAVTKIGQYAFYQHPNLETVRTSATSTETYAFATSKKLNTVDFTSSSAVNIGAHTFNGCESLTHIIIRSSTKSTLSNTNALLSTKIEQHNGAIYVPTDLVSSYKSATNWSTYAKSIYPISDYPRSNFDTISDSWSTVLSRTNPSSYYEVGDTKTLALDANTNVVFQIAAFNTDVLASDSSKTALITWISRAIFTKRTLNPPDVYTMSSAGGWEATYLRTWLISDVLPLLEASEVGSSLQTVTKTFRTKHSDDGDTTKSCSDKIWIPSYREVGLTSSALVESSGVTYPLLFPSGTTTAAMSARIKIDDTGSPSIWWLRSAYNDSSFDVVGTNGGTTYYSPISTYGVVIGFCTGS